MSTLKSERKIHLRHHIFNKKAPGSHLFVLGKDTNEAASLVNPFEPAAAKVGVDAGIWGTFSRMPPVDLGLLVPAIRLAGQSSIFRGYRAKSHSGIRIGRAIDLHRMFSFTYGETPVSLGRLVRDWIPLCLRSPVSSTGKGASAGKTKWERNCSAALSRPAIPVISGGSMPEAWRSW